jgi:hypothetical protein
MWLIVQHGSIEFAKWAHANGCPWETDVIHCATTRGHTEFEEWARKNGCPE